MTDVFKKQILLQSAIALGIVIILLSAIQFVVPELEKAALGIQEKRADLEFLSRATDLVPQLKNDLARAQPLIAELNRVLPPKSQLANFSSTGLNFSLAGERPGSLQFLVTSDATYNNFVKFLKELERSQFFVKVNSLTMTRQASGDKYNVVANAEIFHQ